MGLYLLSLLFVKYLNIPADHAQPWEKLRIDIIIPILQLGKLKLSWANDSQLAESYECDSRLHVFPSCAFSTLPHCYSTEKMQVLF